MNQSWFAGFVKKAQSLGLDEAQTLQLLKQAQAISNLETLAKIRPSFEAGKQQVPKVPKWIEPPAPTSDPGAGWLGRLLYNLRHTPGERIE
jgi:hypothetical protein